ncbi:MAG: hypothetical protein H7Y36_09405 [Armatimonadetes bacterium]|nr:hypothetical protein [Akkermansiaceae bacterium]
MSIKSTPLIFKDLAKNLILAAVLIPQLMAAEIPPIAPEIVSAWKFNAGNIVVVFRHDGVFHLIDGETDSIGMERGTFEWDKASGAFSANSIVDTNGEGGLSHPEDATSISISGNTLTYTVENEGSFIFTRVVNTASAIVGSWFIPGDPTTVTFLADGTYYATDEENDAPFGYDGMERGTYTWNSSNGILTASPINDTNGDIGLSHLPIGFTAIVSGNSMTVSDEDETTILRRINPIPAPLTEPDFEVIKLANHQQTSTATPTLLPVPVVDDFPFWGEAYISDTVSGSAGTLTIGGQAARPFIDDEGWAIETEYPTLAALNANAAFPNGANYLFSRSGGTATLSYPAGGAFPPAPKIQGEDGTWVDGQYVLDDNQTLTWGAHTSYDSTKHATVLTVVDIDTEEEIMDEYIIQGDIVSYDFSGKLEPGTAYYVLLEHVKIANSTTSGTGPFAGKIGYALYNSNTRFVMVTPDEPDSPPDISEQPLSQNPAINSNVTISVSTVDDNPSQTYQWFKDNEEIIGQTANSLSFFGFGPTDYGQYRVAVSNSVDTSTSNIAILSGPLVEELGINRRKFATQETAGTTAVTGTDFEVFVEGQGLTPTFPSASMQISKPNGSLVPLNFDEDSWELDNEFVSEASMLAVYPNGNYQIRIGTDSVPLTIGSAPYPVQPIITSSAGTWQAGKLQITAAQAAAGFTLTTNSSNGNGTLDLEINNSEDDIDIIDDEVAGSVGGQVLQTTIPGGILELGESYSVEVEFDEVTDTENASSFPWAAPSPSITTAFAILSSTTKLTIEVIPNPPTDPYLAWAAGFFNSLQLANSAMSGRTIDFDKDGIANLLEFVLGGDPTVGNYNLLPILTTTPIPGGRNLIFRYNRKIAASGIPTVVEHSVTMSSPWIPAIDQQDNVTIATIPLDDLTEQVTVTIPSTSSARFARLNAGQ